MGKRTAAHLRPSAEENELAEKLFGGSLTSQLKPKKLKQQTQVLKKLELKSAWIDEDDENVTVNIAEQTRLRKLRTTENDIEIDGKDLQVRLKKHFQGKNNALTWADPNKFMHQHNVNQPSILSENSDTDDNDDEEFLPSITQSTNSMLNSSSSILPQGSLEIMRLKDANYEAPSNAVIQSVEFHPNGQLMLTAGLDKHLNLFQVDGTANTNVDCVFFKELPILSAKYTLGGSKIVVSGPRPYFYSYDLEGGNITKIPGILGRPKDRCLDKVVTSMTGEQIAFLGNDGYISLLSSKSYQSIGHLKMNGSVASATFCDRDNSLLSTGSDGKIYKWDLRTRKCLSVHSDEGSMGSSVLAASRNNKYYACGSDSGVVNVYNHNKIHDTVGMRIQNRAKETVPEKALMQLTTKVTSLMFNPDSQILAMASKDIKDALRLVHVPSFTVFANWPTSKTPLHYVTAMAFSPNGGYFACGNARGKVLLYRLPQYKST